MIIISFIFFMALVAALTVYLTRHDDHKTMTGYFLGGRTLSWPYIAFSLLLTNISTEQMVGLNGAAYIDGLSVMAWEIIAIVALIAMSLFFLPRFLKYGITTVPQYLEIRYDTQTQVITNIIFFIRLYIDPASDHFIYRCHRHDGHPGYPAITRY